MEDSPASFPNSGPSTVYIFSQLGAITHSFNLSAALTFMSCNAAKVKAMYIFSLVTTLE